VSDGFPEMWQFYKLDVHGKNGGRGSGREPCSQTGQTPTYDTPATAGKHVIATMLATTRIPAATGTPVLSKGHQQEKPQPQQQKTPATAGSVWKNYKKVTGHEARNMAVNVL
jgi:hypothetical protein